MSTVKTNRNKNYTVMPNYHLRDKSLSLAAKGLMSFLLSLPDSWEYSISGLSAVLCAGKDQIRARAAELEKRGYLVRHDRKRNDKGQLAAADYELFESPQDNPLKQKQTA
ncbi:helix-turn-helix domain-containing protein [Pectinatus haikarae]|uniref:helix-turn-helix domain-containing protein n=1 Tax=Pectinatus haikarae TaxID=349096 RepID=UPI0027D77718|nr:helix-turn-helix domain-containing protein [Pectinatus haikarae]